MWGLRVSRLLDRRAVSGSKSDTPTRAKNCEAMIVKGAGKSKKTHLSPAFAKASVFAGATPDRMAGQAESAGNAEMEISRQST